MSAKAVQARAYLRDDGDQSSQEFRYGWIGPADAMRHLGISRLNVLYYLIKEWNLPAGRMGRLYRFRRADLDAWLTVNSAALDRTA